jgi:hypothetical protein
MKKPVSITTAVVLSKNGALPVQAGARFTEPGSEGGETVIVLIDPVILNLDEDGPAGCLRKGKVKHAA